MVNQKMIERLSKIGSKDHFITSLYLNLEKPQKHGEYKIVLKDLLKHRRQLLEQYSKSKKISKDQAQSLAKDFDKIESYFNHEFVHNDASRGIAIFSCSAKGLWELIELPQPVANHLNADFDPNIRFLSELLCEHRHYTVLLIDSTKAKILDVNLGFVREHLSVEHKVQTKTRYGGNEGTKERNAERAHDEMVSKHYKKVAAEAEKLFDHTDMMWLVIGGQQNVIHQFEPLLTSALRKKVIGHIVVDPETPLQDVLLKSEDIARHAEEKYEKELIEKLKGESSNGGKGIFGLQPTLQSLRKGGVSTLVVTKGFQAPGFVCHKCFFIGTLDEKGKKNTCPICSGPAHEVEDVIEEAITFAYMQGCKVENTSQNSRMKIMGDFGALLRF